jgi:hypothetical protein
MHTARLRSLEQIEEENEFLLRTAQTAYHRARAKKAIEEAALRRADTDYHREKFNIDFEWRKNGNRWVSIYRAHATCRN